MKYTAELYAAIDLILRSGLTVENSKGDKIVSSFGDPVIIRADGRKEKFSYSLEKALAAFDY